MASNIKFKRSAVQNRVPTTAQLDLGELALNTYDGKLYTEINTGSAAVVEIGSKLSSLVVDGDNGAGGGDVTFHGQTAGRDLLWDYSENSLRFSANALIKMGVNAQLFHLYNDGSNTNFIRSNATNLRINSNIFRIRKLDDTTHFLNASGDQISLYHAGSQRIQTTADGADVFGTGSLKIPVGTTAQRSSSPTNGDLRYNTTTGGFEGYSNNNWGELGAGGIGIGSDATNPRTGIIQNRIGVGFTDLNIVGAGISVTGYGTTVFVDFNKFKPGSFNRTIHNYTATAGQTTFTGLNYEVSEKQIAVYLNGARLSEATYTATSGTTVVLDVGASVGDEVEIINIHVNSDVDRKVNNYTATAGQTTFTGLSYNSSTELDVYLNGIRLASADYTATSGSTVVLAVGASVNDIVDIVSTGDGVSFRSTADTSGDRFTLSNVGIGQDTTPDALNVTGNVNIVGVLTATTLHGDGSNLTNTGSTLSEPSSGTQRLVTTSLTTGTMTSSGTGSELAFDYANNHLEFLDNVKATFGTGNDLEIYHTGSGSVINDVGQGYLHLRTSGSNRINIQPDNVQLCHSGNSKLETTSTGVNITGVTVDDGATHDGPVTFTGSNYGVTWTKTGNMFVFEDDAQAKFGDDGDFSIRHASGTSILDVITQNNFEINHGSENIAKFIPDGAVELYHNNSKKFETTSTGASVTGNLAVSGVLTYDDVTNVDSVGIITARQGVHIDDSITHIGDTDTKIRFPTANKISLEAGGTTRIQTTSTGAQIDTILLLNGAAGNPGRLRLQEGGALCEIMVARNTDTSSFLYFKTEISGTTATRVVIDESGHLRPFADSTYDLGITGTRWRNVYADTLYGDGSNITAVNATTLDSIDSGSFLRSDANDTSSGTVAFGVGTLDPDSFTSHSGGFGGIVDGSWSARGLFVHGGGTGDAAAIGHNGTRLYFGIQDGSSANSMTTWLDVTPSTRLINFQTADNANNVQIGGNKIFHAGNDGSGSGLDADTLDGVQGSEFLRSNAADTANSDITFNGGASAVTIAAGSDIRFTNGAWTGNAYGKIQHHSDRLYIAGGSAAEYMIVFRGNSTTDRVYVRENGTIYPAADSTSDLGKSATRWANVYADSLDATGTSTVNDILLRANAHLTRSNHHSGHLEGSYNNVGANSTKSNPIYTIGSAYNPNDADLGTQMYGIGYTHRDASFISSNIPSADAWGLYIASDGDSRIFLSGSQGNIWPSGVYGRISHHKGHLQGSYNNIGSNSTKTNPIYTIGSAYNPAEGTLSDMYGIGYTHINSSFISFTGSTGWGLYVASDGDARVWLDGSSGVVSSTGQHYVGSNVVWNAGNDGSGSGLDADTVDGQQASAFVRHDSNTTSGGTAHILRFGSGSNSGHSSSSYPYAIFQEGGAWSSPYPDLRINYHTGIVIAVGAQQYDGLRFQRDYNDTTELMSIGDGDNHTRIAYNLQVSGDIQANGGSGAVTIGGGSDIRLTNGNWTGDHAGKIQHHNNSLYIQSGSGANNSKAIIFRDDGGSDRWIIDSNGHYIPAANDTYDIGSSSARVRNIYTQDLQLSNEAKKDTGGNDVDGTWGDWTLQEGEEEIFMINNRTGKKYAMMLREVA